MISEAPDTINKLKEFVVDSDVFAEIDQHLSAKANFFEITGIVHREVKHSNFLAWLLDPSAKHGLGDWFFKKILQVLDVSSIEGISDSAVIDILLNSYTASLDVQKEWMIKSSTKRIDILAVSDEHELVVCIENKVWSNEHDNQLAHYEQMVNTTFSETYRKMFIYLTPDGALSSNENSWLTLSYAQILHTLDELDKEALDPKVSYIIDDYKEILKRYIVQDDELDKIARKIYKQHKEVFDIIYDKVYAGKSGAITYVDPVLEKLASEGLIIYENKFSTSGIKRFRTPALDDYFTPEIHDTEKSAWRDVPSPYYYEITAGNNRQWILKLEYSPFQFGPESLAKMARLAKRPTDYYHPDQKWRQAKSWHIKELNDIELETDEEYMSVFEAELRKIITEAKEWEIDAITKARDYSQN